MDNLRLYGAEFLGTLLLVFTGVGAAVAGLSTGGVVVVAFAFGLALLALTYVLGPVSGAHLNPAVTLGSLLTGRIAFPDAIGYWLAQAAGAVVAAFVLFGVTRWGGVTDQTSVLGSNGYGPHINVGGAIVLETVLTFLLVLVALTATARAGRPGPTAVVIGLTLGVCNLVAVPLDGASINPARSLGPALFQGGAALTQLWVFVMFPLLGGLFAALVAPLLVERPPR
jgi:aquaporin Z